MNGTVRPAKATSPRGKRRSAVAMRIRSFAPLPKRCWPIGKENWQMRDLNPLSVPMFYIGFIVGMLVVILW